MGGEGVGEWVDVGWIDEGWAGGMGEWTEQTNIKKKVRGG